MGHYGLTYAERQLRSGHRPPKSSKVPPDLFLGPSTRGLKPPPPRGDSWALPPRLHSEPECIFVGFFTHPQQMIIITLTKGQLNGNNQISVQDLQVVIYFYSYLFSLLLSFPLYIFLSNIFTLLYCYITIDNCKQSYIPAFHYNNFFLK